jgi:hypothetical protein
VIKSLRRLAVVRFASVAKPTVAPTRPTTPWTAITITAMVSPLWQQQVSPLSPRSLNKSMTFMQTMFDTYVKAKKAGKSKKHKKCDYYSSSSFDSEWYGAREGGSKTNKM